MILGRFLVCLRIRVVRLALVRARAVLILVIRLVMLVRVSLVLRWGLRKTASVA